MGMWNRGRGTSTFPSKILLHLMMYINRILKSEMTVVEAFTLSKENTEGLKLTIKEILYRLRKYIGFPKTP